MPCKLIKYKINYFKGLLVLEILDVNIDNMLLALNKLEALYYIKWGRITSESKINQRQNYIMFDWNNGTLSQTKTSISTSMFLFDSSNNAFNCLEVGDYFIRIEGQKFYDIAIINLFNLLKSEFDKIQNNEV